VSVELDDVHIINAAGPPQLAPPLERADRIGQGLDPVDEQHRSSSYLEVQGARHGLEQEQAMLLVILGAVALCEQRVVLGCVPMPTPVLVCPRETERHVGTAALEHVVDNATQGAVALEPVVVVTERVDAVRLGGARLCLAHLRHAQVVETKVLGQVWLVMASEERSRLDNVVPFGESGAVPPVVLRNWVKLRQIERKRGGSSRHASFLQQRPERQLPVEVVIVQTDRTLDLERSASEHDRITQDGYLRDQLLARSGDHQHLDDQVGERWTIVEPAAAHLPQGLGKVGPAPILDDVKTASAQPREQHLEGRSGLAVEV
jgi:hypothetical protein